MLSDKNDFIAQLQHRRLVKQVTEGLSNHIVSESRVLYCGFDPTADSLHLGHLVPLLVLRRLQLAGHKPIALVGGATGLVGDPSFKANERQLNTKDQVSEWADKIKRQVSQFVDFEVGKNSAVVANNLEWFQEMDILSFLRDVGKHFSINNMIRKDAVSSRIVREESGISFTEFSYMLLQSMDFVELNRRYGCTVQVGGSDQWGNIVGGIDLARRMDRVQLYGLTAPLVVKSDGTKFGKTESGTIWLDSRKTSPYAFYQFWLNAADADVFTFLRYFTFLDVVEIIEMEKTVANLTPRQAQTLLAQEVTALVHGPEGAVSAKRITEAVFSGELSGLSETDFEQLKLDGLPYSKLKLSEVAEKPITTVLVEAGLAASGKQVKDALGRGAVKFNGKVKGIEENMNLSNSFACENSFYQRFFLVQMGKKKHHLFEING